MGSQDTSFPRLVSLAAHDLRTPLATVHGFAQTLLRTGGLEPPRDRYLEMIATAAQQLGELLDELGLAARIEGGRYDPVLRECNTLDLARDAAGALGEDRVRADGPGGTVHVDAEATRRAVTAFAQCALRHGGLDEVHVRAEGDTLRIAPITPSARPVVLGEDLRDLGAAVGVLLVRQLDGSVSVEGETLSVRLPR